VGEAGIKSDDEDEEGDLKIAESSANDSGINSSLESSAANLLLDSTTVADTSNTTLDTTANTTLDTTANSLDTTADTSVNDNNTTH
jgi:hypothetical protein